MRGTLLAGTMLAGVALALPANALVVQKTNNESAVVDLTSIQRDVAVGAADLAGAIDFITAVTITIDFSKCAETGTSSATGGCSSANTLSPEFDEISFVLTGPSGTEVILVDAGTFDPGNDPGRFEMTFDDAAGSTLPGEPQSGSFQPDGALSDFLGQSALGTWSLEIGDNGFDNPLVFHDYLLEITLRDPPRSGIPEPASGAALLAGLAALWLRRRPPPARG